MGVDTAVERENLKSELNTAAAVLQNSIIPSGDRTQDLWIRSPTRYPLR